MTGSSHMDKGDAERVRSCALHPVEKRTAPETGRPPTSINAGNAAVKWWVWAKSTTGSNEWVIHLFKNDDGTPPFFLTTHDGELIVLLAEPCPDNIAFRLRYAAGMWHSFGRGEPL